MKDFLHNKLKSKIYYALSFLLILLLAGCSKKQQEEKMVGYIPPVPTTAESEETGEEPSISPTGALEDTDNTEDSKNEEDNADIDDNGSEEDNADLDNSENSPNSEDAYDQDTIAGNEDTEDTGNSEDTENTDEESDSLSDYIGKTTAKYAKLADFGAILNVRDEPSKDGKVVGFLVHAEKIEVISIENGWAKFIMGGKVSYVNAEFLVDERPEYLAPPTPTPPATEPVDTADDI